MRVYRELGKLIASGERCALATLVSTAGSSPQNSGAKVIFLPEGGVVGTIGGGCMEAEAQRASLDALRTGQCRLFDLRLDGDFGFDDGLICGGRVSIFVNPRPERSAEAYRAAVEAAEFHEEAVLATLIRGPAEGLGQTVLVRPGSSPAAPEELRGGIAAALDSGSGRVEESGERSWYVEPLIPRPTLVIAGAGHVGAALGSIASVCGFEVLVVDDRPSYANAARLPFADRVIVGDIPGFLRAFAKDEHTYIVIVTRGHRHDGQCLREVVRSNARYVGMIGSRRKICVIYEELLREGSASPDDLKRVHSPLGLAIGAKDVGEIAVSIAAELVAVRRGVATESIASMKYTPPFIERDR